MYKSLKQSLHQVRTASSCSYTNIDTPFYLSSSPIIPLPILFPASPQISASGPNGASLPAILHCLKILTSSGKKLPVTVCNTP